MKKISAVTINFNTDKDTHEWISSMENVEREGMELSLVIVDNGSDNAFALTDSERKMPIKVIRSEENTGFTGGNNIGMSYALKNGAEYILIINNDTLVKADFLKNLIKELDKDEKIGVTVPKIYFAKGYEFHKDKYREKELGRVFWYAGGSTDWKNIMSIHTGVDEVDNGQYDSIKPMTFASGCCLLVKRTVLERVGLFDERFFLYFEDADLDERILKKGYTIMYVPTAIIWHKNASSTGGSGSKLQDYFMTRNRMLFGMKYAPLRSKLALFRESIRLLISGRPMQKKGIQDFYFGRFGMGSYFNK